MLRSHCLFVAVLATWAPSLAADTQYVIDKLLVGVHEQQNLDSAIIKVLPTGTRLEVIERAGELALIEDEDKVRGWVDATFLTTEPPARVQLATVEREKQALETRLKSFTSSANVNADVAAQVELLTKENTELKGKLSGERLAVGKLQSEVANLRSAVKTQAAPPDARIVELERERGDLERDLAAAEQLNEELKARGSLTATSAMVPMVLREYYLTLIGALLVIIIAAFAGGVFVVDWMNRRRHGGFRI